MSKDKIRDERDTLHEEFEQSETASRARNRTVMLTPEMTGQVRALVNTDRLEQNKRENILNPMSQLLPPMGWTTNNKPKNDVRSVVTTDEDKGTEDSSATAEFTSVVHGEEKQESKEEIVSHMESTPRTNTQSSETQKRTTAAFSAIAAQPTVRKRKGKVAAFLISFDNDATGEVYEISTGRWLITSKPTDQGDYILLEDESISPLHAIIRALDNGKIQVLDQLSEFGTFVTKPNTDSEEEISGTTVLLEHGSGLRFGNRRFVVCLVPTVKHKG